MKIALFLVTVGIFCLKITSTNAAEAIQIVAPVNHKFQLKIDQLKSIVEHQNIKDRHVVVVSIAGAFRQGKSFILNFFLKYLYAQYKTHDISDWIGEKSNGSSLNGFKWRAGRKRETLGIWMWSEVFTHDNIKGEKVAIILLDTQGVFDDQSSVRDCTTIFALSTMMSSVQCYNIMQNIREDDLQHLELFTEYGLLVLEQSKEKPFQKLLFIVRDWPYAYETNYGSNGQKIIDETLAGNDDQTPEMRQLRMRIQSSFDKISAFLMPFPGTTVAQGNSFTGDIRQIDGEFIKYVKELVPALFAPENLIVKRINGQIVRARDLVQYLETYTNTFNGDKLPEPKSVLMATAEATNLILTNDCMGIYTDSMRIAIEKNQPFFKESELMEVHRKAKEEAMKKFNEKPKLGSPELTSSFLKRIENGAEEKFAMFKLQNENKRKAFIEKSNQHNDKLSVELSEKVKRKVMDEASNANSNSIHSHLNNVLNSQKQGVLDEFKKRKMGDDEISRSFLVKLEENLKKFQIITSQTLDTFDHSTKHYNNKMQTSIDGVAYLSDGDFSNLHQNARNEAISQFQSKPGDNELKLKLQPKIEKIINEKRPHFEGINKTKRQSFTSKATAHTDAVRREIKATFENKLRAAIGKTYRNDNDFINLFMNTKQNSLKEFASKKMGNDAISNQIHQGVREQVERELDGLQATMKQLNESNKPPPPPPQIVIPKLNPLEKGLRETDRIVGQVTAPVKRVEKNIRKETKNIGKKIKKIFG